MKLDENSANPLAWEKYASGAKTRGSSVPSSFIDGQELLAETDHFFCVAGKGAFVKGYVLVLPKEPYPSFAETPSDLVAEAEWFTETIRSVVKQTYASQTLEFEHGACGCLEHGHSHYHIMSAPAGMRDADVIKGINATLEERCAGIDSVELRGAVLQHPEDMRHIISENVRQPNEAVVINGRQHTIKDYQKHAASNPISDVKAVVDAKVPADSCTPDLDIHYTYFNGLSAASSMLTFQDLGSQFGRQAVYEAMARYEGMDKPDVSQISWNWRVDGCESKMLSTMKELAPALKQITLTPEARKFGYRHSIEPSRAEMIEHDQQNHVALYL